MTHAVWRQVHQRSLEGRGVSGTAVKGSVQEDIGDLSKESRWGNSVVEGSSVVVSDVHLVGFVWEAGG